MHSEPLRELLARWRTQEVLEKYGGLRFVPAVGGRVRIIGTLEFEATVADKETIVDSYDVEILVPVEFPDKIPTVNEIRGRIPRKFHKLEDGSLCLGSPMRLRLMLLGSPTLLFFVERCLVPYLYSRSYYERHGAMPFGELEHGTKGLLQDMADIFGTGSEKRAFEYVRLAAAKRRHANKQRCPCGGALRLGQCHNGLINDWRDRLGRGWFQSVYSELCQVLQRDLVAFRSSRLQNPTVGVAISKQEDKKIPVEQRFATGSGFSG